jgi:hypothetical protein
MVLDRAGPAVIACDNTAERELVAIKRFQGIDKSSMRKITLSRNNYVVSIIETFFEGENMVIVYEHMDISLRNVTSILQGQFKPFHIAGICEEVSLGFNRTSLNIADPEIACGRSFFYT